MKRILFIVVFAMVLGNLIAQTSYRKIGVENRQWSEYILGMWGPGTMKYYKMDGHALRNGELLPRLVRVDKNGSYINTMALIKEDTAVPAITFYRSGSPYGDSIYLDLSLSIGDSSAYFCAMANDTSYYVLDSVGAYIDEQGISRRQYSFFVRTYGAYSRFKWVEGLGSVGYGGILNFLPVVYVSDWPIPTLLCVSDSGGVRYYQNPKLNKCEVTLGSALYRENSINFYPNPVENTIIIPGHEPLTDLVLVAEDGRVVRELKDISARQMDVSDLPHGIYFLMTRTPDGRYHTALVAIGR